MKTTLLILLAITLSVAYASAQSGASDRANSWETNFNLPPFKNCTELDKSLIVPVPVTSRANAIAKLADVSVIPLSQQQTETILTLNTVPSLASAQGRIRNAIAELKEQKRRELEDRIGSWGQMYQVRLDALEALNVNPAIEALRPYLVRAVAKSEGGAFFVSLCGDILDVFNGGLWAGPPPPSIRLPIIVFLGHAPKSVFARAATAQ